VYGPDGTPLYSWRVLILPYIEEQALFADFRLNEPWDSPHNIALLDWMPIIYAAPGRKKSLIPPNHTICHVFLGKGAAFEGNDGLKLDRDFPDGSSNTLLFVEAENSVPWTKPEEIPYDPTSPLPELRGFFKDGFRACWVDGSRTFVRLDSREAALRAAITRNGGEPFSLHR
jgi:hypothetical protein